MRAPRFAIFFCALTYHFCLVLPTAFTQPGTQRFAEPSKTAPPLNPFQSPIDEEAKPRTWCNKIPRQICAPENCRMEQGAPECREIVLESTVKKPEEVCDLQPTKQCHQVTNLVPHLEEQVVCKDIPKEVCHLRLDNPRVVQRPVTLRWCTKPEAGAAGDSYGAPSPSSYGAPQVTNRFSIPDNNSVIPYP